MGQVCRPSDLFTNYMSVVIILIAQRHPGRAFGQWSNIIFQQSMRPGFIPGGETSENHLYL